MQIAIDTLADVNLKPNLGGSEQRAVSRTETAGNAGLSFSSADKARAILEGLALSQ
jgi:hypothetical protein|tara:strand:- start:5398 stop:5565 length:168 start_codon:yes stop_codon:yes gene_type:complete